MAYFTVEFMCSVNFVNGKEEVVNADRRNGPFTTKEEAQKHLRGKGYRPVDGPVYGSEPGTLVHKHDYWTSSWDGETDAKIIEE